LSREAGNLYNKQSLKLSGLAPKVIFNLQLLGEDINLWKMRRAEAFIVFLFLLLTSLFVPLSDYYRLSILLPLKRELKLPSTPARANDQLS
jgi:hypothetical protein